MVSIAFRPMAVYSRRPNLDNPLLQGWPVGKGTWQEMQRTEAKAIATYMAITEPQFNATAKQLAEYFHWRYPQSPTIGRGWLEYAMRVQYSRKEALKTALASPSTPFKPEDKEWDSD